MLNRDGRYLVTGGSGFLGKTLIRALVAAGCENVVVVARNEGNLVALKSEFPKIEIIPGDVADPVVCAKATQGVNGIFHLAAFKHVTMAETDAYECVKSNVNGTMNLLVNSMGKMPGTYGGAPDFFVFISTDKAAQVRGVYGASKLIGEKLVAEFSNINPATKYFTIRYGNVFGSTGSFIHKWIKAAQENREIVVTDPEATRFFFTVDQAVDLILDAVTEEVSGLVIPKIKAVSMKTIMEAFAEKYGWDENGDPINLKWKHIGLQAGENKHETMDGVTFSDQVPQYTKDEFILEFLCRIK